MRNKKSKKNRIIIIIFTVYKKSAYLTKSKEFHRLLGTLNKKNIKMFIISVSNNNIYI